jgi:hypothetical protein
MSVGLVSLLFFSAIESSCFKSTDDGGMSECMLLKHERIRDAGIS